jgi:hypothetical protein
VLNASPGAAIFGRDMLFDIPFLVPGNARPVPTQSVKTNLAKTGIIKLVMKNCYGKTVFSANQKAIMYMILGLSQVFIQMAHLGFNAEQIQND